MSLTALSDIKVLEWSDFVSGPYCGKLLADLGAEVIKIEKPGCGDHARRYGPFPNDSPHHEKSGLFMYLNTNKLGITLNLACTTGTEIFRQLVKWADVFVENHPPKEIEELGFSYESLKKLNQSLVMTSISRFGQTGPYRDYRACDLNSFHVSGMAFINPSDGVDDAESKPPLKAPEYQGDMVAGLSAGIATMSAVIASRATGEGQHVDLSEQEALASIMRREYAVYTLEGINWIRPKSERTGTTVSDIYRCKDGLVYLICFQDRMWEAWLDAMGNPEWARNELFTDRTMRRDNWDVAKSMLEEWTMQRSVREVVALADARRVPCKPVNSVTEVVNSELLAHRDYFIDIDHGEAGKVKLPGAPYKLSGTPWALRRAAPLLGEHNHEIYCNRLGYTQGDLVRMRAEGVI